MTYIAIEYICPFCEKSHEKEVLEKSLNHFCFLECPKTSKEYKDLERRCPNCPIPVFPAYVLEKLLKEIKHLDKLHAKYLLPTKRTRTDLLSKPAYYMITPTFPSKNPCDAKYKLEKLLDKIMKLDPDSRYEGHFEIGKGKNDKDKEEHEEGVYHYHFVFHTKMAYCKQNLQIIKNIIVDRVDIKKLVDGAAVGKSRNYIKKDLKLFKDKRLQWPSYENTSW